MPRFYTGPLSVSQILAPTGVPFPSLPGLIGRYKANTGVTLSGPNVVAVADQSGMGNNLVNSGTVPFNASSAYNGLPAFDFQGAGAMVSSTMNFGPGTNDAASYYAVGQMNGSTASFGGGGSLSQDNSNDFNSGHSAAMITRDSTNNGIQCFYNGSGGVAGVPVSLNTNMRFGSTLSYDGVTTVVRNIYLNGTSGENDTNSTTFTYTNSSTGNFGFGARWTTGTWNTFWYGPFLEVCVGNLLWDSSHIAALDNYYTATYGF